MSARDLLILALGAILGVLAQQGYDWFVRYYRRHLVGRSIERLRGARARSALRGKTMHFYRECGLRDSLYTPSNLGVNGQIPILAGNFALPRAVDPRKDDFLHLEDVRMNFPVDKKLIRLSARAGARIFDGEILYVESVEVERNAVKKIELKRCNFFAVASISLRIQKSLRTSWRLSVPHKRHFASFQAAIARPLQPQALGCTCVTLFEVDDEILVALARRSPEVLNESGVMSALPSFGVESNIIGQERSHYSLLFYNYFKEFAEEFFDVEELVQAAKAQRVHPDWVMQQPAVKKVIREFERDRLTVEYLGMAVGPSDGVFKFALLARFKSSSFYRQLEKELHANWESSRNEWNEPPVQFISLFDPLIDRWADCGELGATSAFAIDLARKRLTEER